MESPVYCLRDEKDMSASPNWVSGELSQASQIQAEVTVFEQLLYKSFYLTEVTRDL